MASNGMKDAVELRGSGRREQKQRRGWGCVRPNAAVRRASNPTIDVSFCAVRALNLNFTVVSFHDMEGGLGLKTWAMENTYFL